jgi:O-antigen ligase
MDRTKYLLLLTKLSIILMFFVYYVGNFLVVAIVLLIVSMFLLSSSFFSTLDKNKILIMLYLIFLVLISVINLNNDNLINVDKGYLYIKTSINGLLWIAIAYFAYSIGKILGSNEGNVNQFLKFCLSLFLINGVVNIITWVSTTGGVISRYSFVSPITNTVSAGILYSLLGYFLVLALPFKKKIIALIFQLVFIINIIIIGTRQVQIVFCIYAVYYYLLSFFVFKNKRIKLILLVLMVSPIVLLVATALLPTLAPMYKGIFDLQSADYYTRQVTQKVAFDIFLDNPIFGIGYGMFGMHNSAVVSVSGDTLGSAHSGIFSLISEWGIIGLFLTVGLFINIIRTTSTSLKNAKSLSKLDIVGAVVLRGTIVSFFISNFDLFPPPNERSYYLFGFILWIIFGIISQRNSTFIKKANKGG